MEYFKWFVCVYFRRRESKKKFVRSQSTLCITVDIVCVFVFEIRERERGGGGRERRGEEGEYSVFTVHPGHSYYSDRSSE